MLCRKLRKYSLTASCKNLKGRWNTSRQYLNYANFCCFCGPIVVLCFFTNHYDAERKMENFIFCAVGPFTFL